MNTLIEKLEKARQNLRDVRDITGFMLAMKIVRKHEAEQPQDVVERVAMSLYNLNPKFRDSEATWNNGLGEHWKEEYRDQAKAVLATLNLTDINVGQPMIERMAKAMHSMAFYKGNANVDDCLDEWRDYAKAALTIIAAMEQSK